ncbi:SufE family protein [Faunimonas sp. B44]|uniref:SufE family protein n=1 Tax=Faunimonas sp. B44 TaxID=3461493 RepID=UPI004044CB2C
MTVDALIEDFQFLDDWEDRYRYVIELGKELAPLSPDERCDANKVRGCASQVWLVTERSEGNDPVLTFRGDSDALIVRGLIAVLLEIFSGRTAQEILAVDAEEVLAGLGLREHLTSQRSNGLSSMVARIRRDAAAALA